MPSTFLTFTTGTRTLFGTTGDDTLTVEYAFNTILAGSGKDTLEGSEEPGRLEKLYGGRDDDLFLWTNGDHVYHGGQPGPDHCDRQVGEHRGDVVAELPAVLLGAHRHRYQRPDGGLLDVLTALQFEMCEPR